MSAFGVRTVVFPTDFSNCSRHAGETAAAIARQLGAHLHVVHVDPPVTEPAAASRLARALTGLGDGFQTTTITLSGIPARQISTYARRVGADLIVIGTHGRTGVSRALLGSVAEAVVRHAPCPVLTVPMAGRESHTAEPVEPDAHHCVVCARFSRSDLRSVSHGDSRPGGREGSRGGSHGPRLIRSRPSTASCGQPAIARARARAESRRNRRCSARATGDPSLARAARCLETARARYEISPVSGLRVIWKISSPLSA